MSNKLDEVKHTILSSDNNVDICGFTETFLNDMTNNDLLEVDDFYLHRKDRGTHGGGIIVYVSKRYNVLRRLDLEMSNIETLWLEINFTQSKSLLLCYVYRPPNSLVSCFDDYTRELDYASTLCCSDSILIGDFNIDLKSKNFNNEKGKLNDIMQLYNYNQLIKKYTRVTETTKSLIDHIYVKNLNYVQESVVSEISLSDHYGVGLTWKRSQCNKEFNSSNLITYRQMKNFYQNTFINDFNMYMHLSGEIYDVDELVNNMTINFKNTLDKHAPIKQKKS